MSEHISTFVSTAEGAVRDIAPEQVSVPSVTELTREAFVAGVSNTQPIRDHIKVCDVVGPCAEAVVIQTTQVDQWQQCSMFMGAPARSGPKQSCYLVTD